ncbi:MAG: hypothetical protein ACE5MG_08750 [Candidatus Methylomirabilales bacterium]
MGASGKFRMLKVFPLLVTVLAGCATAGVGVGDLPEKPITDLGILVGTWSGTLTDGTPLVTTIKADGSWTNVVRGETFVGTATISGGKVHAESLTTGIIYIWRLHEGSGRRVLVWVDVVSGKVRGTTEFSSAK